MGVTREHKGRIVNDQKTKFVSSERDNKLFKEALIGNANCVKDESINLEGEIECILEVNPDPESTKWLEHVVVSVVRNSYNI